MSMKAKYKFSGQICNPDGRPLEHAYVEITAVPNFIGLDNHEAADKLTKMTDEQGNFEIALHPNPKSEPSYVYNFMARQRNQVVIHRNFRMPARDTWLDGAGHSTLHGLFYVRPRKRTHDIHIISWIDVHVPAPGDKPTGPAIAAEIA